VNEIRFGRSATICLVVGTVGVGILASGIAAQEPVGAGLNILLTNDDGYAAPGITSMRDALIAAGHTVTVVAPLDNRSGSSSSVTTSGVIDYTQKSDGVWAVDGTPADAVALGFVIVMRDNPPDLVVSGSNFGHNVGANVVSSGTVGAALTASRLGVPALAVSVAIDFQERDASPRYRSTLEAFAPAADLVVDLIRQLHESDADGLLPARTVLNVNYPAVGVGEVTGVRFAPVASVRAFRQVFAVAGDTGPARVETTAGNPGRAEGGSDYDLLSDGYITISVLDGNLDAGRGSWESLLERLIIER